MHTVKGNLGKRTAQKKKTSAIFFKIPRLLPFVQGGESSLLEQRLAAKVTPTGHAVGGKMGGIAKIRVRASREREEKVVGRDEKKKRVFHGWMA